MTKTLIIAENVSVTQDFFLISFSLQKSFPRTPDYFIFINDHISLKINISKSFTEDYRCFIILYFRITFGKVIQSGFAENMRKSDNWCPMLNGGIIRETMTSFIYFSIQLAYHIYLIFC